jgi:hypothetical protein
LTVIEITDTKSFSLWLRSLPEEKLPDIASFTVSRLAVRALVGIGPRYNYPSVEMSDFVARSFRACIALRVAVREPTNANIELCYEAGNGAARWSTQENQPPNFDAPSAFYASRIFKYIQSYRETLRELEAATNEKNATQLAEELWKGREQESMRDSLSAGDAQSRSRDDPDGVLEGRFRMASNNAKAVGRAAIQHYMAAQAARQSFNIANDKHLEYVARVTTLAESQFMNSMSIEPKNFVLESLRDDAERVVQAGSITDLARLPLWKNTAPQELQSAHAKFAEYLSTLNGSQRPILLDWYETVAAGKSAFGLPENIANDIEKRIALGDNRPDFWNRSFEEINTEIESWLTKEIAARHPENLPPLSLSQRPAPHSFDIEDGKIVAVATRSSIAPQSIADQVNAALLDKAKSAQKRLARTQAPEHYCRSIETLVSVLEANEKGIATGRLMMVSTSIESIARAIDSPDGRSEYGLDVVAEMNDLAASLDEFKALFPEVMKILAESLAHKLAVGNAVSVNIHINEIQQHAAHSTVVSVGAVEALREGDEDVARQTKIIESSADDEQRAAAIEARARTVSQRLLTVRNFVARSMKSLATRTVVSVGKGYDKAIEDSVETGIKLGIAALVASCFGPLTGIAMAVFSWKPFAKRAEEIANENIADHAQDI